MSFLAPLFLLTAAAGVIPVLLHMINRQRAKEQPFASLRFLQISVQKTRRRQRLHDVLLMFLRAAVLVLIALGLASPTITELPSFFRAGRNAAVAIVLDNSASMGTIDDGRPRFETAKRAAAQILDRLAEGDQVAIFLSGGPEFPEQGRLDHMHDRVRQMLAAAKVSCERANLGAKLQEARRILAEAEAGSREIFVITDMQRLSWEGLEEPQAEDGDKPKGLDIPIIVVDCNRSPQTNAAVTGIKLDAPVPVAGMPVSIVAEVFNSSTVAQKRRLELFIDGSRRASGAEIDIPPGGTARDSFQYVFNDGGLHRGEVKLAGDDGCPLDDGRWFAVEIDRGIAVAVVKGKNHEIAYLDEAFYLEQALSAAAASDGASGGAIQLSKMTANDLASEPLSQYKIVFCVNLPAPSPEAAARLAQYVEGGGNLFWIAGDETDPEAFNRADEASGSRLLPGSLAEVRIAADSPHDDGSARDSWHIAQLDKDYPPFEQLLEPASLYSSVLAYKRVGLRDNQQKSFRVLARLDDGEPFLVERNVGRGRVLLLAASLNTSWTNFPLRPIFLPLLLRTVFELSGVRSDARQAIAGAALTFEFAGRQEPLGVEVVPPTDEIIRRKTNKSETGQVFRYSDTHSPGVYLLRQLDGQTDAPQSRAKTTTAFAVNADPEESQAEAIDREKLKELLGIRTVIFVENPDDLDATFDLLSQGRVLWQVFLYTVLAGLVFETFLSNRFSPKDTAV